MDIGCLGDWGFACLGAWLFCFDGNGGLVSGREGVGYVCVCVVKVSSKAYSQRGDWGRAYGLEYMC